MFPIGSLAHRLRRRASRLWRTSADSWDMVQGISNHEHARKWQPGNGALCTHTIIRDGNRMHLGISTGGHYLARTVAKCSRRPIKASAPGSRPIPIPSSASACTRSRRQVASWLARRLEPPVEVLMIGLGDDIECHVGVLHAAELRALTSEDAGPISLEPQRRRVSRV